MGGLGAIEQDVQFDWVAASDLSTELRWAAEELTFQAGERETLRVTARGSWLGRFGDEFDGRVATCVADATRCAGSLTAAATAVDELASLASAEQARRVEAREWVAEQNDDDGGLFGGVPVVGDIEDGLRDSADWVHDRLTGEEVPPELAETPPPTIALGDPGVVLTRVPPPAAPTAGYGTGGVSSADPSTLDAWAAGSRALDSTLVSRQGALSTAHSDFVTTLGWGSFDASSLLGAVATWLSFNETDAQWVTTIAATFRASGSGVVPDAVIQSSLNEVGLGGSRAGVTYDEALAYGLPPTSGYADDPVNTASGNFVLSEVDCAGGGLLTFARVYNSRSTRDGPFGVGWGSWASVRLRAEPDGAHWVGPDGQEAVIPRMADTGNGVAYERVPGISGRITVADGGLVLAGLADASRLVFDGRGRVVAADEGPGTEVRFGYDDGGRLVSLRRSDGGRAVALTWDGDRVVGLSAPGCSVTYRYDESGRLVAANERRYSLDADGRIVAVTDADGVVEVRNTYDDEGRVVAQVSPHGRETRYRYLPGRVTVVSDDPSDHPATAPSGQDSVLTVTSDGPVNHYVHDDHGRLVGVIDGHGNELRKVYDAWGNPTQVVERDGATLAQQWDDRGRLVRQQRPDGSWFAFTYDDLNRVLSVSASTGASATTRFSYAGAERSPVTITDPEGAVTRLEVADGLVRRVVDPDGVELRFSFDAHGDLIGVADAEGNRATIERDPAGRVVAAVSPMGRRSEITYDDLGRPVTRDGWRYSWSAAGRLLAVTDPAGGRREVHYGTNGEAERLVDELGHATTRRFLGNLVDVVLPDGARWAFDYDKLSRLTTVDDPAGSRWTREHDVVGRLVGGVDPQLVEAAGAGDVRATYSPAGRLLSITSALGHETRFEYDRTGRRVAVVDPLGNRWSYRYDADGHLTETISPTGQSTRYEYDERGLVRRMVDGLGGAITFDHDGVGRLVAQTNQLGRTTRWEYDAAGRVVRRVLPTGEEVRRWYDAMGRVSAVGVGDDQLVRYSRDALGRAVVVDEPGFHHELAWDPFGRLTAKRRNGLGLTWRYDDGRATVDYPDGTSEEVTSTSPPAVTPTSSTYDADGQLTGADAWSFAYDGLGRLISETGPAGSVEYAYNPAHQLVSRQAGSSVTHITYDAAGRRTSDDHHIYEWDWLGRLCGVDDTRLTVDALGDLAEVDGKPLLWDPTTPVPQLRWIDGSPAVGGAVVTDPWGAAPDAGGLRVGYRGELEIDGLLWLRNRTYDPATRTFLSPDPVPAVNPYTYAANDPVRLVDPLGLHPLDEAAFARYREAVADAGVLTPIGSWIDDNWEYIVAGAMIGVGGALLFTGAGTVLGGALLAGGFSAGSQRALTGEVNWRQVGIDMAIGGASAGAGSWAGGLTSTTAATWSTTSRVALQVGVSTSVDVSGGMLNRQLTNQNPFDPTAIALDTLTGATSGSLDAAGTALRHAPPPRTLGVGELEPGLKGATSWYGDITIRPGLSADQFVETLRHEQVHAALSPTRGAMLAETRRSAIEWLHGKSHLYKYSEEALAEGFATHDLRHALRFPLVENYDLIPRRIATEAAGVVGVTGTTTAAGLVANEVFDE